jgi:hypothetical protein
VVRPWGPERFDPDCVAHLAGILFMARWFMIREIGIAGATVGPLSDRCTRWLRGGTHPHPACPPVRPWGQAGGALPGARRGEAHGPPTSRSRCSVRGQTLPGRIRKGLHRGRRWQRSPKCSIRSIRNTVDHQAWPVVFSGSREVHPAGPGGRPGLHPA